jgi:hypothetical protein
MSEVADGPETNLTGRGGADSNGAAPATAQGPEETICPALTRWTWGVGHKSQRAPADVPDPARSRCPMGSPSQFARLLSGRCTTSAHGGVEGAARGGSVHEIAFLFGQGDAPVTRTVYVREIADARRRAMRRCSFAPGAAV